MSVVQMNPKMQFRFTGPGARNKVLTGLLFLADFVLTFWVPALVYCLVIYESRTFYPMAFIQPLGVLLGVFMYYKRSRGYLSCVPVNYKPDVPKTATIYEMKKVA